MIEKNSVSEKVSENLGRATSPQRRPLELLSPAGHWPQLYAAIEAGADAVYFGLHHFSARAKVGFNIEELPDVVTQLHRRGVKAFVTFNTLVFDHELAQAETAIAAIATAGADAVIVQDLGIARWIRAIAPDLVVHGSTQMSVTNASGVALARSVGCRRVVLGRELSLHDIASIAAQTDVELEVFVHGALCVSYSGQCFSSEAWGGRSANRGQCAQACRLSYDLIVDGTKRDLGPYRYLLSPGDLCAIEQIPQLLDLGVACVKIEGRYKDADYVALVTDAYRRAIDAAVRAQPHVVTREEWEELEQIYSRGLGPHFMGGTNHQRVVVGRAPRHRGVRVGRVTQIVGTQIEVELERKVYPGDGLVFDAADRRSPELPEQGGFVFDIVPVDSQIVRLQFAPGKIDFKEISPGDWVWRTNDPRLVKKAKKWTQATQPVFRRPISFRVKAVVGEPLRIEAQAGDVSAQWLDRQPVAAARTHATDASTIRNQLDRLGGTPFRLGDFECELSPAAFVPASTLNSARRELVEQLLRQRTLPRRSTVKRVDLPISFHHSNRGTADSIAPRIHVLVRNPAQLAAAISLNPDSITLDYLDLYGLRESVEGVRAQGIEVRVASPRIIKPGEQNILRFLLSLDCALLIRSGGLLWELLQPRRRTPHRLIADFSLNVANHLTAQALIDLGADVITPTHDLNAQQIAELTLRFDARRLEVIVYHHLPIFHTEHCVFCRFLSTGTDRTNCGQPCERHEASLRDSAGRDHPILADVGCRNTVFNAAVQSGAKHLRHWMDVGIRDFRLEFVHQRGAEVAVAVESLRRFISGDLGAQELEVQWRGTTPAGTTEGSFFTPANYKQLVPLS